MKVKKFKSFGDEEYEHNDDEGYEYTLLRDIAKNDEYIKFRKHWTTEIRNFMQTNEKFTMTDQIASSIILDITEMIKSVGYEITKKND